MRALRSIGTTAGRWLTGLLLTAILALILFACWAPAMLGAPSDDGRPHGRWWGMRHPGPGGPPPPMRK